MSHRVSEELQASISQIEPRVSEGTLWIDSDVYDNAVDLPTHRSSAVRVKVVMRNGSLLEANGVGIDISINSETTLLDYLSRDWS